MDGATQAKIRALGRADNPLETKYRLMCKMSELVRSLSCMSRQLLELSHNRHCDDCEARLCFRDIETDMGYLLYYMEKLDAHLEYDANGSVTGTVLQWAEHEFLIDSRNKDIPEPQERPKEPELYRKLVNPYE